MALKYPFTVEGSLEIVTPHFVSSTYAFFFFAIPMDCPKLAPNAREITDYHRNVTGGTPVLAPWPLRDPVTSKKWSYFFGGISTWETDHCCVFPLKRIVR